MSATQNKTPFFPIIKTETHKGRLASQVLFLAPFCVWSLAVLLLTCSSFAAFVPSASRVYYVIRDVCLFILLVREVLRFQPSKEFFAGFVTFSFLVAMAWMGNYNVLIVSLIMVFCAREIPFETIARALFAVLASVLFLVVAAVAYEVLPNLVYDSRYGFDRHYFGFSHPNTGASIAFFASCAWMCIRQERARWYEIIAILFVAILMFLQTGARTAFALSLLLVLFVPVAKKLPLSLSKSKVFVICSVVLIVAIALVSVALAMFYSPDVPWMRSIDDLLSARLSFGHKAIEAYGIPWFGQDVSMPNIGGYNLKGELVNVKNPLPVDCAYVFSAVRFGILFGIIVLALLGWATKRVSSAGGYMLLAVMLVVAIFGIFEKTCLWSCFNVVLFLLGQPFCKCNADSRVL